MIVFLLITLYIVSELLDLNVPRSLLLIGVDFLLRSIRSRSTHAFAHACRRRIAGENSPADLEVDFLFPLFILDLTLKIIKGSLLEPSNHFAVLTVLFLRTSGLEGL